LADAVKDVRASSRLDVSARLPGGDEGDWTFRRDDARTSLTASANVRRSSANQRIGARGLRLIGRFLFVFGSAIFSRSLPPRVTDFNVLES